MSWGQAGSLFGMVDKMDIDGQEGTLTPWSSDGYLAPHLLLSTQMVKAFAEMQKELNTRTIKSAKTKYEEYLLEQVSK